MSRTTPPFAFVDLPDELLEVLPDEIIQAEKGYRKEILSFHHVHNRATDLKRRMIKELQERKGAAFVRTRLPTLNISLHGHSLTHHSNTRT